ncbi:uncharacterized protein LOC106142298 [Amyelois transitella]|uniref:uncharacterized protein LOC106142298 n=1 Tax=Amyelois transitella TaxID=680683 RepID=UPI00298F729B|nr:uncharacterized protein LOC106142298 [Amyelois transitella]
MSSLMHANPEIPSPDNLIAFVPYACGQLFAPFRVRFISVLQVSLTLVTEALWRRLQLGTRRDDRKREGNHVKQSSYSENYASKGDAKSKKSKAVLSQLTLEASPTQKETVAVRVSSSDDDDTSDTYVIKAVVDSANNALEISINGYQQVPRLLIKILALCVPYNPYLSKISLRSGLSGTSLYETVQMLTTSQITYICLDDSNIPERNYHDLLEYQTHLQVLSLARCSITDAECALLIPKLAYPHPASKTLVALCLTGNYISDEGARLLGQALRSNRALTYLNLCGNRINNNGAVDMLRSLMEFPVTSEEMVMKRKRTLYFLKLYKDVYSQCLNELKNKEKENSDEYSRSSKKKINASSLKQRRQSVTLSGDNVQSTELVTAKAEKMASDLVSSYPDPFRAEAIVTRDQNVYSTGNLTLTYLNLAYNYLGYQSLAKLLEVVKYQALVGKYPDLGLMEVQLEGNPMPVCLEMDHLTQMLSRAVQVRMLYVAPQMRRGDRPKKTK